MDEYILPDSLDGLTSEDLQGQITQALAEFNRLSESNDVSDATLSRMELLAEAIETLRARRSELATNATRLAGVRDRITASDTPEPEPVPEPEAEDEPEEEEEPAPEVVTAAAPARQRSTVAAPSVSVNVPEATRPQLVITAAADIPRVPSGSRLDLDQMAQAMHLKACTLADHSGYVPIASIDKTFEDGYDLSRLSQAEQLDAVRDLSGANALVASGGWCAPSEIIYSFFDLECARGSVLQLPSFKANRGGAMWPVSSPLPAVNSVDWVHTEDDDIAGYEKPCIVIPCPTFDECRLAAHGVCVTAGNLMDRAYPENVRRYLNQVFIAHERDENLRKIAILVAGSDAAVMAESFGAASALINAILLQAADYRDKFRMCDGAMLEAVFPMWVRDIIRGDLARQQNSLTRGGGLPTNGDIDGWFRAAGITTQFVNDWQPIGGADPSLVWPATVKFLLYAPGTWLLFDGGTLDLGVVRDSVLNSTNDFTAAWTESFWCIGLRGYESRIVTANVCPSGEVSDYATFACASS